MRLNWMAWVLCVGCVSKPGAGLQTMDPGGESLPVADTTACDVLADAPWRVRDSSTPIPFQVVVVDAWRCNNLALHSVTIEHWKNQWNTIYQRTFDTGNLADDDGTREFYILQVDRFSGGTVGLEGEPITPARLQEGDAAGADLEFRVTISAPGCEDPSDYVVYLRVHVAEQPFPHGRDLFAGWLAGDTHVHTNHTNNFSEFGLPHRSLLSAGRAMGLDWVVTTDHSCDLDRPCGNVPGVDNTGSRVKKWTFCQEMGDRVECVVRDHSEDPERADRGWTSLVEDAADAMQWGGSGFLFISGEEVNVKSTRGKTLHLLELGGGYVPSPSSGAPWPAECTQTMASLQEALTTIGNKGGLGYAAHPTQSLPDVIQGGAWLEGDVGAALQLPAFRGLQLWNMRQSADKTTSDNFDPNSPGGLNPFPILEPCAPSSSCYPHFLVDAVAMFDHWASALIAARPTRSRFFMIGGSDAHGDLNYTTSTGASMSLSLLTDSAFGKVRTVVFARSLSADDVLEALREGRAVITDGPMMTLGLDRTGDGTLDQLEDAHVGSRVVVAPEATVDLIIKWQSTVEFGGIDSLRLYEGTGSTDTQPREYDLLADPQDLGDCDGLDTMQGVCHVRLSGGATPGVPVLNATHYLRAVAIAGTHRVLTNPIWMTAAQCVDADGDGHGAGSGCEAAGIPGDCDDGQARIHVEAMEECNAVDDDCDGLTDEGCGGSDGGIDGDGAATVVGSEDGGLEPPDGGVEPTDAGTDAAVISTPEASQEDDAAAGCSCSNRGRDLSGIAPWMVIVGIGILARRRRRAILLRKSARILT